MGENNGSTIDFIVFEKVVRGRSSGEIAKNANWYTWGGGFTLIMVCNLSMCENRTEYIV